MARREAATSTVTVTAAFWPAAGGADASVRLITRMSESKPVLVRIRAPCLLKICEGGRTETGAGAGAGAIRVGGPGGDRDVDGDGAGGVRAGGGRGGRERQAHHQEEREQPRSCAHTCSMSSENLWGGSN